MSTYELQSPTRLLNDSPEHLDFHIKSDDYFSFLATVVGFIEEALGKCDAASMTEKERCIAKELRHDLRYVQANYTIAPRPLGEIGTMRPSGNILRK